MDQQEMELLEKHMPNDPELKALWEEHILYEKQLEKLTSKSFRTPSEEVALKQLKKQKLDGKTRLMALLAKLKKQAN
jgi:uncharacterized protein YdcH (DUF465 family)